VIGSPTFRNGSNTVSELKAAPVLSVGANLGWELTVKFVTAASVNKVVLDNPLPTLGAETTVTVLVTDAAANVTPPVVGAITYTASIAPLGFKTAVFVAVFVSVIRGNS